MVTAMEVAERAASSGEASATSSLWAEEDGVRTELCPRGSGNLGVRAEDLLNGGNNPRGSSGLSASARFRRGVGRSHRQRPP